ncbi:MAG TPA: DUF4242 domain-containing protein, partial [Chthoniobacterales bacterium]|nr:DUF4242 domain-containing protein [Chthoniobacterales bacterium]
MPVYMDVHEVGPDVTAEDIAKAHARDVEVQDKYGVSYDKYYFNEKAGKIFCLCHAPSADAAVQVHKEAHGLLADQLIEIDPQMADLFMGAGPVNTGGAAMISAPDANKRDPGVRTILFTDIVDSTP